MNSYPNYEINKYFFAKILNNDDVDVRINKENYPYTDAVFSTGQSNETNEHIIYKIEEGIKNKESKNIKAIVKTNIFINEFKLDDFERKIWEPRYLSKINFATGEIKDKPGTFLDFYSPETLDEQLSKIYELTEEEQELMAKSIKPWKDKLDVDADGLY